MTGKERLEGIKNSYLEGIHSLFGTPWVSMPKENLDWLINRVEELEEEVEKQKNRKYLKMRQRDDFMKKAQRYKQALELIYKDTFYESEHDLISPIHVIRKRAEKALEGEG